MHAGAAGRTTSARSPVLWPAIAAAVAFGSSFTFTTILGWHRDLVKFTFAIVAFLLLAFYVRRERVNPLVQIVRRWMGGIIVGAALGALLVSGMTPEMRTNPTRGLAVVLEVLWSGGMYGTAMALMVNVLPVIAVYGSRPSQDLRDAASRLRWAAFALAASLVVAGAFFLGFEALRGPAILRPLLFSALTTVAYLLAGNPLAAILPTAIFHAAAVTSGVTVLAPWQSVP
jgi:hypothetical protein